MKISRMAEKRHPRLLAEEDVCTIARQSSKAPRWDQNKSAICFGVTGHEKGVKYGVNYSIELRVKELERLLSVALSNIGK